MKSEIPDSDFTKFTIQIESLIHELDKRFTDFASVRQMAEVFYQPLSCNVSQQLPDIQLELCDLQSDSSALNSPDPMKFWKLVSIEKYPTLKIKILRYLSMFGSSYICECSFSAMNSIKSKKRVNLSDENLENLLRVATSKTEINLEEVMSNKRS